MLGYSWFAHLSTVIVQDHSKQEQCLTDLQKYFPDFVWLIRDQTVELEEDENGNPQTWTQFIKAKVLVRSENLCLSTSDEVVRVMLHLFPSLACRVIPHPCNNPAKSPDKVSPDFNTAIEKVTQELLSNVSLKVGLSANFDGSMFANLAREYVKALNSGENITIEGSLYATIFQKLEDLTEELVKQYWGKMGKILEPKYPLEEGTMDDEEDPPTKLMAFHQQVFKECKLTLRKKADMYMPTPNTASPDASTSTIDKKKVDILTKFQKRIYMFEAIPSQGKVLVRGELHQFVTKNKRKSSEQCTLLFDDLVQQDDVRLTQLKQDYMAKAVGPAKEEVFEKKAQWISGPPEYVKLSRSTHNHVEIMWKKPTIHVDAAQNYEVQRKEEGKKWISSELTPELYKVVDDLRPNVYYHLRVRGVNNHSKGEWSRELVVTTPPGKPNKPKRPDIRLKSSTTATLHIQQLEPGDDNGSAVTHVRVESKLQDSPPKVTLSLLGQHQNIRDMIVTKDVSLDQSATCDGFYYFRVSLQNSAGESKPSEYTKVATRELIPGPPQNPIYKKPETNQIVLQWRKPNFHPFAVEKYEVERENATGGTWDKTVETQSNVLTATVRNLEPNTKYKFRICAVNENKKGESSEEFEAQTKPGAPSKPSKPIVTITAPRKATITVQPLEKKDENGRPVTHVKIEKSAVASSVDAKWSSEEFEVDSDVALIKQDINLENCVQFFRVRMKNEVGDSEPSEIVEAPYLIPGSPQNIYVEENLWVKETSHNRITISWDKPDAQSQAVKEYEVEMRQEGVTDPVCETIDSLENLTATFSELKPNTVYKFRVRSINEEKRGEWSKTLEVKSAPGPPCQPSRPVIQVVSAGEVFISINKLTEKEQNGSPVTYIKVEERSAEDTSWKHSHTIPMNADLPVIQKAIPLTENISYFRVSMVNEVGESNPSEWVLVPDKDLIPGPPQNVECSKVTCNEVQLSWKEPTVCPRAAKQYEVEMKTKEDGGWTCKNCDKLSVSFKSLHPSTKYWFRVRAKNGNREGKYSKEVFQKTDPGPPNRPSKPEILVKSDQEATITVPKFPRKDENGSSVVKLIVQVCTEADPNAEWFDYKEIPMICDKAIQKNIELKDDSFYFRVLVENGVGRSEPSDHVEVPAYNLVVPGRPENFDFAKKSHNSIDLKWDKPQRFSRAAKCYEVEIKDMGEWTQVARIEKKLTAHILNLKPNNEYHFRVIAISDDGRRGEYSHTLTTQTNPGPPSNPQKPQLHQTSATTATLIVQRLKPEEENGSFVTHVIVESSKVGRDWHKVEFQLADEKDIVTLNVALHNGIHYFRVRMKNDFGISGPSPVVDVPPAVFPGKPKNVKASVTHDQVLISWQQPEINSIAATKYEVEKLVRENQWVTLKVVDHKVGCPLKALAERLRPKTKYQFRVCAVNSPHDKRGEYQEISANTIDIPGPPRKIYVIERGITYFMIGWEAPETNPEYIQHYVVHFRRDRDQCEWQHLQLLASNCVSVAISGLEASTYYQVCVRALNQNGNGGSGYVLVSTRNRVSAYFLSNPNPSQTAVVTAVETPLPEPFNKSNEQLNEERIIRSNVNIRRF